MTPNSFLFGAINSVDEWGLHVIKHDTFMPPKRSRKIVVPDRSGAYDYGAKYYDERALRLECSLMEQISNAQFREIIYGLCQKKQIRLWDEPDKYYIGELYDPEEVLVYPCEAMRDFELAFVCEPFAYKAIPVQSIQTGNNKINYRGTAEAPTLIEITNPNSYAVSNIILTAIKRRS